MAGDKVSVEILGRTFELDAEGLTPIEANAIAQLVSDRMQELKQQTGVVDTSRLAVLTALNFADELTRLQKKQDEMASQVLKRSRGMIRLLEEIVRPGNKE